MFYMIFTFKRSIDTGLERENSVLKYKVWDNDSISKKNLISVL